MPTYVYGCDTCGHRFEQFQKFSDASLTECPECGARIRKIFQPAGIVFKGSGWHITDSRAKTSSASDSASSNGSEDGGEKKDTTLKGDDAVKAATKKPEKSSTPAPAGE